ncbi:MAG: hypothetical protein A2516_01760 [Alphaproteobacteria bacterium RIFOXYD12_FULL_60_8]|nr:MAG: hypothetical protein A2516_01760 [Alphaproteobacteria bacterium RIFOXYD12_FULL_60_8]
MNRFVACLGFTLVLGACSNPWEFEGPAPQTEAERAAYLPQSSYAEGDRMYCYQSLGDVVCYAKPVHRDTGRLIWHPGSNDPPPELPVSPQPY